MRESPYQSVFSLCRVLLISPTGVGASGKDLLGECACAECTRTRGLPDSSAVTAVCEREGRRERIIKPPILLVSHSHSLALSAPLRCRDPGLGGLVNDCEAKSRVRTDDVRLKLLVLLLVRTRERSLLSTRVKVAPLLSMCNREMSLSELLRVCTGCKGPLSVVSLVRKSSNERLPELLWMVLLLSTRDRGTSSAYMPSRLLVQKLPHGLRSVPGVNAKLEFAERSSSTRLGTGSDPGLVSSGWLGLESGLDASLFFFSTSR